MAAFAAAVQCAPENADHWAALGVARLELADALGAAAALRRARTLAPHHPRATEALATLMRGSGDRAGADGILSAARATHPDDVSLRLAHVANLIEDQEHDAALALLGNSAPVAGPVHTQYFVLRSTLALKREGAKTARALLDAAGPSASGFALPLACHRVAVASASGDEAEARQAADAATALLRAPVEPLQHRIAAHFKIARFRAARDETDAAFGLWQQGHRLIARLQPFDRETYAAFVDASIAQFNAARLHDGPRAANSDPAPVFVVGMPRSGTTLAEQILAGHHAVFGAGERGALAASFARLSGAVDTADAVACVVRQDASALTAEADRYLQDLHALAPGTARIVDKMPGNFRMLGLVALLMPQARIIHCVRDPRDIGFSIFSRRFLGHHPYAHDLRDLGWYIAQHHRLMAHWSAVLPNPILRLHLHDWMEDLPGTLARLLEFLGLDYDAKCERFFELDREVRTASRAQVRRPMNRAGLGRWRAYAGHLLPMIEELIAGGALAGATKISTNGMETSRWPQQPGWPPQAGTGSTPPTGTSTAPLLSRPPPIPPSSA
ncbi:MAG: sulfotransferase [Proteobacteria bacterium]|nr:sulfotransferase [Pseudomonadota bacterium]